MIQQGKNIDKIDRHSINKALKNPETLMLRTWKWNVINFLISADDLLKKKNHWRAFILKSALKINTWQWCHETEKVYYKNRPFIQNMSKHIHDQL